MAAMLVESGWIESGCRTRATVPSHALRSPQQSSITFGISDASVNNSESYCRHTGNVMVMGICR
jgi:hypothetical protein